MSLGVYLEVCARMYLNKLEHFFFYVWRLYLACFVVFVFVVCTCNEIRHVTALKFYLSYVLP